MILVILFVNPDPDDPFVNQEIFKKKEDGGGDDYRNKKIHVRSKDPSRIARQFEKGMNNSAKQKGGKGVRGRP